MTAKSIAKQIIECFKRGNRVFIFGNGGSLADASHWAAEFNGIGPVIALNDPAKITSIGNDFGYIYVFSRQIKDMANEGDMIIGLSSSGNSANVNNALEIAPGLRLIPIDFPRKGKNTQEVQNWQYEKLHEIYILVKEEFN